MVEGLEVATVLMPSKAPQVIKSKQRSLTAPHEVYPPYIKRKKRSGPAATPACSVSEEDSYEILARQKTLLYGFFSGNIVMTWNSEFRHGLGLIFT